MSDGGLRVLIVDDERPAREKLRRFVGADPEVGAILEAAGGVLAVEAVRLESPDIMFLDVQMPDLDGFGVVDALAPEELPHIVFVTAFDRYAVRAFDVHAVDYLLKPFDADRLARALARAKDAVRARRAAEREPEVHRLMETLHQERKLAPLERVLVEQGERVVLLPVSEIDWLEAHRNYVRLHARAQAFRVRTPIGALESRLDPAKFVRIGRSTMVAVDRIAELLPTGHGDYEVRLTTGRRLVLSRRYRDRLEGFRV